MKLIYLTTNSASGMPAYDFLSAGSELLISFSIFNYFCLKICFNQKMEYLDRHSNNGTKDGRNNIFVLWCIWLTIS